MSGKGRKRNDQTGIPFSDAEALPPQRQPSPGATCFRIASMTWAL